MTELRKLPIGIEDFYYVDNYAILCLCKSQWICKLDFMEAKDGKRMFA